MSVREWLRNGYTPSSILNPEGLGSAASWTFIFEVAKGIPGKIGVLRFAILEGSYYRRTKMGQFGPVG